MVSTIDVPLHQEVSNSCRASSSSKSSNGSSTDTVPAMSVEITDDETTTTNDPNNRNTTTTTTTSTGSSIEYSPCTNTGESHTSTMEEIQQQHQIAEQLLATMTTTPSNNAWLLEAPPPTTLEIPIRHKRRPVMLRQQQQQSPHEECYCWSSRGTVNVTALQSFIRNGYNRKYDLSKVKIGPKPVSHQNKDNTKDSTDNDHHHHHHHHQSTNMNTSSDNDMNYWDPITAAQSNVYVRRPSHDAWGIPKIVFIYCDDFLQNIYTFPWLSTFRAALQPILNVLQIPMERVARMLLASLPNGSTIPLHYDTGEWVKYTHRIHVPVLVHQHANILFRCGPTAESLQRISCHEGHVFEINNQAYHTVSNCDTDYRVHLILDYIDEAYWSPLTTATTPTTTPSSPPPTTIIDHPPLPRLSPRRYSLQKGEIIYQTRRSIDRFLNFGQRKTPTFMILGSQKAGTTYLFECIMSHPLAIKPKNNRRETHSLDWNYKSFDSLRQQQQYVQSFYYDKELQYHPSCFTGDSTPSYLMDHVRVIPRMKRLYQHPVKFIVLCRHPIHRAISHYAMVTSTATATPAQLKSRGTEWRQKSFAQVALEDLLLMKQCGLIPYWSIPGLTIHTKMDDTKAIQFILDSMDTARLNREKFDTFTGSVQEETAWTKYITQHVPLQTGSYGLLSRGLYHIQIRMWIKAYPRASDFLIYKFESVTGRAPNDDATSNITMKMIQQIWNHIEVPFYEIPREILDERQNSREYTKSDIIDTASKLYHFLQRFYELHNEQLHSLLLKMHHQQQAEESSNQSTDAAELFDHHWGSSSIPWTD